MIFSKTVLLIQWHAVCDTVHEWIAISKDSDPWKYANVSYGSSRASPPPGEQARLRPSAISHAVRSVEDRLAIPLFASYAERASDRGGGAIFRRRRTRTDRYSEDSRRIEHGTRRGQNAIKKRGEPEVDSR